MILLEFDFTVVVKKGTTHLRADHLSRLTSGEKAIGVDDDLPDAYLFNIKMVPHWSKDLVSFLTIGKIHLSNSLEGNLFHIEQTRNFVMLAGRLYKRGSNGVLRLCIEPTEADNYMTSAHVAMGNIHFALDQTIKRIERMGVFWPTMRKDVFTLVNACGCQKNGSRCGGNVLTLNYTNAIAPKWAESLVEFLSTKLFPENMSKLQQRYLQKHAQDFCLIADQIYHRGKDGSLRVCVLENEYVPILEHAHASVPGGHFSAEVTTKAIMRAGLWWPTLFQDAALYVKGCDVCQRTKAPIRRDEMPLRPMMGAQAFAKWGIDFVGPIHPAAMHTHAEYIIVATNYVTKWVEAKATIKNDARTTAKFLYEYVFTRYGLPIEIVSDRGTHFLNEVIEHLLEEFMVIHKKSAPYHPQANGQAESTNKILCTVLTKIVSQTKTDWEQKLHAALWAYRVAYKTAIGTTPFNMVFGLDAILPMEFLIPTLRVAKSLEWTGHEL